MILLICVLVIFVAIIGLLVAFWNMTNLPWIPLKPERPEPKLSDPFEPNPRWQRAIIQMVKQTNSGEIEWETTPDGYFKARILDRYFFIKQKGFPHALLMTAPGDATGVRHLATDNEQFELRWLYWDIKHQLFGDFLEKYGADPHNPTPA